jgi:hypothetical protein
VSTGEGVEINWYLAPETRNKEFMSNILYLIETRRTPGALAQSLYLAPDALRQVTSTSVPRDQHPKTSPLFRVLIHNRLTGTPGPRGAYIKSPAGWAKALLSGQPDLEVLLAITQETQCTTRQEGCCSDSLKVMTFVPSPISHHKLQNIVKWNSCVSLLNLPECRARFNNLLSVP